MDSAEHAEMEAMLFSDRSPASRLVRTSLGHSQVAIRRHSGLWIQCTEPSQRSQGLASCRGAFADPG